MACAMGTVPYAMAYSSAAAGGERGGGKVGSVEAGSLNLLSSVVIVTPLSWILPWEAPQGRQVTAREMTC